MKAKEAYNIIKNAIDYDKLNLPEAGISSTKRFKEVFEYLIRYKVEEYDEKISKEDKDFEKYNKKCLELIADTLREFIK